MPDEDAHQHQHHCSKLRQMDSSRLTGMDTVEVAEEERESVESNLDEHFLKCTFFETQTFIRLRISIMIVWVGVLNAWS